MIPKIEWLDEKICAYLSNQTFFTWQMIELVTKKKTTRYIRDRNIKETRTP